jgi:TATA-binding protein-associated factor
VTPRPYQRDGISWLAFLRRFGLHGILADDMVGRGAVGCTNLARMRSALRRRMQQLVEFSATSAGGRTA